MADPNLANFNGRLKRIHDAYQRGARFETADTARHQRRHRARRPWGALLRPLLIVLVAVFGLKTMIYSHLGASAYQARVTEMRAATGFTHYGAVLMQADPVTRFLAASTKRLLR
ncbi:hypothetical protein U879_09875 [Defluviimonas sp. 20V17]|uniref:Uncharacterized protein n=1 Tax=Allgaiera indica TaxID=765699 RepID=A0AAN4ZYP4_9RHOB|nr:hypothetical protein [Allgaiera indica]KDB03857.1 hypothetical protein U879_09875 [Defluviimonas sp. 20V17]GHE00134.1 hypothetical protein GCM10008024_10630 [Allgaiera indica]SDW36544.1 hypothetical protein SAMN05444006_10328 [Allgaiera indica]